MCGPSFGRVDLLARTLAVAEQGTRGKGGAMVDTLPKSGAGGRTVSVPAPLIDLLAGQLALRALTGADSDAHIMTAADGAP